MSEKTTAVIGAGSWGTALAIHAANCGHRVRLWVHSEDTRKILEQKRVNEIYLPGFPLPPTIEVTSDRECMRGADYSIFAVPSLYFRDTFERFLYSMPDGIVLISAIKGMEPGTSKRISEIVKELSQDRFLFSVLSGPSFAQEVAQRHPTAVVLGMTNENVAQRIQKDFSSPDLRLYHNPDVIGIEIGGAVKNIIAIAAGIVTGLNYGHNTIAGLITRGLAELNRLAVQMGAHPATLSGLAGMGDLILTCTGHLSRNRQVGIELGRGKTIEEITGKMRMVAEGVRTTEAIYRLAQEMKIDLPITEQVYKMLYEKREPREAILDLMTRGPRQE